MERLSVMGVGFIGSRYCELYPNETVPEARDCTFPTQRDVLWLRSTTDNYGPIHGDLHTDINTNLNHVMDVLPTVNGVFNLISTWFCCSPSGQTPDAPAREDCVCDPNGFYSITALAREKLVRSYQQSTNRPYRILRLCNVIGNDPRAGKQKNALEMMLGKIKKGEDIEVYDGDNWRNILHVNDVCRAIHCVLEKGDLNTIYNIGSPQSVRIYDLVQHALYVTGSKSRVTLVPVPRFHKIVQVSDFWMSTDKLRALGFVPDMDPYEAVERVLANL